MDAIVAGEILLGVVVCLNLVLTLALIRRTVPSGHDAVHHVGLKSGDSLPDFNAGTLSGEPISADGFRATSTAFIFVSPTCVPCRQAMPEYLRLIPLAKGHGTNLVIVSDGDPTSTREMADDIARAPLVILAPRDRSNMFTQFRVPATPHWAFVDEGRVVISGLPSATQKAWRDRVRDWELSAIKQVGAVSPV